MLLGGHGMPPPAWHRYRILFGELRRGRDETYSWCDLVTFTFNAGGHGTCCWCGSTSSICTPTSKFLGLAVQKIRHMLCIYVSWPVTLTFDFFDVHTGAQCSTCHGILLPLLVILRLRFPFMSHWAKTAQTDHVTLCPWRFTLEVMVTMADAGGHPPPVYQVRSL